MNVTQQTHEDLAFSRGMSRPRYYPGSSWVVGYFSRLNSEPRLWTGEARLTGQGPPAHLLPTRLRASGPGKPGSPGPMIRLISDLLGSTPAELKLMCNDGRRAFKRRAVRGRVDIQHFVAGRGLGCIVYAQPGAGLVTLCLVKCHAEMVDNSCTTSMAILQLKSAEDVIFNATAKRLYP